MRTSKRKLRAGDLVRISTPSFYSRDLDESLEGKSGVILDIREVETPIYSKLPTKIYDVLIDGVIIAFYSDKYMRRV